MIRLSISGLVFLIIIVSFFAYIIARSFDYEKENQKLKLELKCIEAFKNDRVR